MNEWSKEQLEEMFGNDIIGQLAFLAGCHTHRFNNDSTIPNGWIVPDEALEKFAELIVRDCMKMCSRVQDDKELSDYEGGFRDGALLCRDEIKEHFGIE